LCNDLQVQFTGRDVGFHSKANPFCTAATIAVITPTVAEAQFWFDLLEEELGAYHRAALMSRRDDLTRRFNVHFTEVRETKGLEFNVVILPDIGSFALDSDIGRNQAYVAISRAKHSLLLGCAAELIEKPEIKSLERNGLVNFQDIPTH
jgi:superfamily I DNA/RNA helicase